MKPVVRWLGLAGMLGLVILRSTAAPGTTPARVPLTVGSNESTSDQLDLARMQGDAVQLCWEKEKPDISGATAEVRAGEYRLVLTLTRPEGWYQPDGDRLAWHEPDSSEAHLRVLALDGADGRLVPGLKVHASMDGGPEQPLPFGWYPLLNGYGANLRISARATHEVRIRIAPATFYRHDPYNGDRFTGETVATFNGLVGDAIARGTGPLLSETEEKHSGEAGTQGGAFGSSVREMWRQATSGAGDYRGDYRVEEAVEYAEAYWFFDYGHFTYKTEEEASSARNCHIEIAPRDASSGRFLPEIPVTVTVWSPDGREIGTKTETLMWHPWLYHYGANWRVPHGGAHYRIKATFPAPAWPRYGRHAGNRFAHGVEIEFRDVAIKSGEK